MAENVNEEPFDFQERIMTTLSNVEFIGASPELSSKLFKKIKDEKAGIEEIAALILQNPPLCASLLKISNSAFYNARSVPIQSISKAILLLGFKAVANYVLAFELVGTFQAKNYRTDIDLNMFWKNSFAGALIAQNIAADLKLPDLESVFLSGLLRNMGVLVIRQYFPEIFTKIYSLSIDEKISFSSACTSISCLDHRYVGYLLALRWNLPSNILSVFQKASDAGYDHTSAVMVKNIVQYADYLLMQNKVFVWDKYYSIGDLSVELFKVFPEYSPEFINAVVAQVEGLIKL